jgi:FlaA1/EpsC-like NDP-sugar epimerase
MYSYSYIVNRSRVKKSKKVVIYGSGNAALKLESEFKNSKYEVVYFIDDAKEKQNRSIDSVQIVSPDFLKEKLKKSGTVLDMLVISIPTNCKDRINQIFDEFSYQFNSIKLLPSFEEILEAKDFKSQLKDISVEDLLARRPKDLDKLAIKHFIKDKKVLVTGAGGSIGSEIVRQCYKYKAKEIILVDHSEYNLYSIEQEFNVHTVIPVMQSVVNKPDLLKTFEKYQPDIVIHAAAYKHVPLCESNIDEAINNNVLGTKNVLDIACSLGVEKVVLISTDKAVRPTSVMGATKRVDELYAQNKQSVPKDISSENKQSAPKDISLKDKLCDTEIVAVRFGNVLGSSGSVIPKFKAQIQNGQNITVTHPEITRYFMLIPEACELVLQAGSLGSGGEIFILDMGEPVKIVDLAKQMIKLSGRDDIDIEFTGLRPGEKLYEELLIDDSDMHTKYESIMVAKPTKYDIDKLNKDIEELLVCDDKISKLKDIVPEFQHRLNDNG